MNKRIARKLISKQKNSLNVNALQNQVWRIETLSYIRNIFGEKSVLENAYWGYHNLPYDQPVSQETTDRLKQLFDVCLSEISNGNFKENKITYLFRQKFIYLILSAALVVGYIFGAYNNPKNVFVHLFKEHFHLPDSDTVENHK